MSASPLKLSSGSLVTYALSPHGQGSELDQASHRERARLRGQLKIYTAQGRVTGWVLCLLPFIMFGLLSTVNWQFEKLLFTEDLGRIFIYVGLGLMALGVVVIRKIIDIRV